MGGKGRDSQGAQSDRGQQGAPVDANALEGFSGAVHAWFDSAFPAGPTTVQQKAWGAIGGGDNVLVIAPTGSGKTLAAFLHAIDRIMAEKALEAAALTASQETSPKASQKVAQATPPKASQKQKRRRRNESVRTLYISPMKALGADVERNLATPLNGIAKKMGLAADDGPVLVGMRTGDTSPDERRRLINHPPDILITTPESLYLMLTSKARETLRGVETVIVDELHAIAGSKRGAHLAISLERLDDLLERPAQRIGLSATVRPPEEVARFLGGIHAVRIVRDEGTPAFDLEVRVPVRDMTAISPLESSGSPSIWPHIEASILDEVESHQSTIVFVNSRGLCEKLTARLNELYARRHGLSGTATIAATADGNDANDLANTPDGSMAIRSSIGGTLSLGQGAPALIAKAHHGSVSKDRRHLIESELKRGELRCVVATSSLELGIDMGEVDLVLQVAPPLSVASGLQRIGRANHQVGGRSHGIIYPRVRTDIIDAAVTSEGMAEGAIERTSLAANALDVLAQQTVAAAAMQPEGLDANEWFATVRRAANYATLTRDAFDAVITMLSGTYNSAELAEFSPRVTFDAARGLIIPRPNAQRLAVTAAGTIPDRGMFPVMLPQSDGKGGRRRVGELDEEMVMESRVGDVITLGTSPWRITEIGRDRVLVVPAEGRASRLPFWHGDSVGRDFDAGRAKGAFVRAAAAALDDRRFNEGTQNGVFGEHVSDEAGSNAASNEMISERAEYIRSDISAASDPPASDPPIAPDFERRLIRGGLDENARHNLVELVALQRQATGSVPTDRLLVAERCTDETGDWRLILHSPFGRRVHLPWALAVSMRIREALGFDPEALAADDGIMLRIPLTEESMPTADVFRFSPEDIDDIVRQNIEATALFAARFRECAARALTMTPPTPGKRAPLWQQRLKGGQLLEAARNNPGFPLLAEAARECLTEVYDIDSLKQVLSWLDTGDIRIVETETAAPSPFAAPLMFGYVIEHLYDGDLPHAERSASLLSVDPALLGELLGQEDPAGLVDGRAFADVESVLQRTAAERQAYGAEGVFDMLRELGPLTADEVSVRTQGDAAALLGILEEERRALPIDLNGRKAWIAYTDAIPLHTATGAEVPEWALEAIGGQGLDAAIEPAFPSDNLASASDPAHPLDELAARFALTNVPFTADDLARNLGTGSSPVMESLRRLEGAGRIKAFGTEGRWVAPSVLRRLRNRSRALAEAAAAPVSPYAYMDYLLDHQGLIDPESGIDALARTIETFEGLYLPWDAWEGAVFPARVADYSPAMLDDLLASGDVLWCCRTASDNAQADSNPMATSNTKPKSKSEPTPKPEIAFFPTDSPLAPIMVDADFDAAEELVEVFADKGDPWDVEDDGASGSGGSGPKGDGLKGISPKTGDPAPDLESLVTRILAVSGPMDFAALAHTIRTDSAVRTGGPGSTAHDFSNDELARSLRGAALAGHVTCDSFQFVRSGQLTASSSPAASKGIPEAQPLRRTSSRRGLRSSMNSAAKRAHREQAVALKSFQNATAGTWMAIAPSLEGDTAQALGLVEGLLDCYGVITRDIAIHAHVPGALTGIYPVLRAMEDAGELIRGLFINGLGPAQFCGQDTLERIRATAASNGDSHGDGGYASDNGDVKGSDDLKAAADAADTGDAKYADDAKGTAEANDSESRLDGTVTVIAAEDPIWLYGGAVPWPDIAFEAAGDSPALDVAQLTVRPKRAPGSLMAIHHGMPTLLATAKLKGLIAFTSDGSLLRRSIQAILAHTERSLKAQGSAGARTKIQVETLNGIPVNDTPLADVLKGQGLVWTPEGLRLYVNPF